MEGDKEHWDEIVQIVQTAKSNNQTPLDSRRDAELRSGVYSHIDTMYPNASAMEASPTPDRLKESIGNRLLEHLQGIFRSSRVPAMALTVVAIISVGLLLNSTNNQSAPYFELPESLNGQNLLAQIDPEINGSRALIGSSTERQKAFKLGALQADIDIAKGENTLVTDNIVLALPGLFEESENPSAADVVKAFRSEVAETTSTSDSALWFKEGYHVELIELAAKGTLSSFKIEPLQDAIQLLSRQSELTKHVMESDGLNPAYVAKREALVSVKIDSTPGSWQQAADLARSLQATIH